MGEEAGLLQDEPAGVREVVHRRGEPLGVEPLPGEGIPQLGPLAQGEQRLVAPCLLAGAGDLQHLFGSEVGGGEPGRGLGERAVATAVAAEHGERDEDLGRVRHTAPVGQVALSPGQRHELGQRHLQEFGVGKHCGQSRHLMGRSDPDTGRDSVHRPVTPPHYVSHVVSSRFEDELEQLERDGAHPAAPGAGRRAEDGLG